MVQMVKAFICRWCRGRPWRSLRMRIFLGPIFYARRKRAMTAKRMTATAGSPWSSCQRKYKGGTLLPARGTADSDSEAGQASVVLWAQNPPETVRSAPKEILSLFQHGRTALQASAVGQEVPFLCPATVSSWLSGWGHRETCFRGTGWGHGQYHCWLRINFTCPLPPYGPRRACWSVWSRSRSLIFSGRIAF